ncbi:MAG TPA: PqqD family protein [Clostridiales bacterium]|nr:PqqD family protein [Clostridiales bacterium]
MVEIIIPRDKLLHRIIRIIRNTPEVMRIRLDDRGSYVWQMIDGYRTVEEIGGLLNEKFGERAAPIYERLWVFLRILSNNGFITFCSSKLCDLSDRSDYK